jgi:hypothetical protein
MPRFIASIVAVSALLALSALGACTGNDSTNHKHPPQDPPDYKGVPTDTTPPSMLIAPGQPQAK